MGSEELMWPVRVSVWLKVEWDAPVGPDALLQPDHIGVVELGKLPVLQNFPDDGVVKG